MRLMPTSITVAPGLTQSPCTIRGRPTAATSTSARRQTAARSRVREWQMVTVALAREQQLRDRLADEVRAPDHDRLGALELDASRSSSPMQPAGVHGRRPGRPLASRPGATRA